MNISLRQLQAFVAVAQHRSFTKAAEQIHVTQAGLSAMIRELEAQLGARLFSRTTRSVELNELGTSFLPFASRTVRDMEATVVELGLLKSQTRRHLRIGITPFIAGSVAPTALEAFRREAPDVELTVFDTDIREIQRSVESGEYDVGFGSFFAEVSGIERKAIASSRLVLVSPADDYQKVGRRPRTVDWSSLASCRLIALPEDNPIQVAVDARLKALRIGVAGRTRINHLETVIAMVEAGIGMAILPSFVYAACSRHRVEVRLLRAPEVALNYYSITRAGRGEIEVVQRFVDCFVRSAIRSAPACFFPPEAEDRKPRRLAARRA